MAAVEQVSKPKLDRFPLPIEVQADDTLRELFQVARMDLFVRPNRTIDHLELVLDRRHKFNPSLSKPVAYYHFSTVQQLLNLGLQGIVGAIVLSSSPEEPVDELKISRAVDDFLRLFLSDMKRQVKTVLQQVRGEIPRYTMNRAGRDRLGEAKTS